MKERQNCGRTITNYNTEAKNAMDKEEPIRLIKIFDTRNFHLSFSFEEFSYCKSDQ